MNKKEVKIDVHSYPNARIFKFRGRRIIITKVGSREGENIYGIEMRKVIEIESEEERALLEIRVKRDDFEISMRAHSKYAVIRVLNMYSEIAMACIAEATGHLGSIKTDEECSNLEEEEAQAT
jgi:hypothetical protein